MQDLTKILPQLLKTANCSDDFVESACIFAWKMSAGEAVCHATLPFKLVKRTFLVKVSDETWKKQLQLISGQLLFKINALLGTPLITHIEFLVDAEAVKRARKAKSFSPTEAYLDPELVKFSSVIHDESLREQFLKAASKYLQAQQQTSKL
ncbi:MAG: DUF721 domain-containing protein [Blastocatellia bacterium]|nr:DUF721 domain-containing protein [Blastocatellia bacterium]